MLTRVFVLVLFLSSFICAIDVDFECPDEIFVSEEFKCSLEVIGGGEEYDVKVEADKERDSVLRIWDDSDGWKSGYYYLIGFVEDRADVRLKIKEIGRYDLMVKLRRGDWREEFDTGRIKVLESKIKEEEFVEEEIEGAVGENIVVSKVVKPSVISLNGDAAIEFGKNSEEEGWDYVSKDGMVVDWLPYVFCLFLIFLVGILIWERF
jgi:hypothetical protein